MLKIDFALPIPIYTQIRNSIVADIAVGELQPGDHLPGIRTLANQLGVNLHTVNKAYQQLQDEGFIQLQRGRGSIVCYSQEINTDNFKQKVKPFLKRIVAEAVAKQIDQEVLHSLITKYYGQMKGKEDEV